MLLSQEHLVDCEQTMGQSTRQRNLLIIACRDSKIKQKYTVPETPQQNGVAERFNRTLVEMGRSLLIQAKLPKRYRVRALSTAAHIRNLIVTVNSQGKSPFELFIGKPPRRNHLRVFGCTAYVMKKNINLRKLDSRSVKAKFIGYDDRRTAYILQELTRRKSSNCAMLSSEREKSSRSQRRKR